MSRIQDCMLVVHHFPVSSPIFLSTGRPLPWQASFNYHTDMVKITLYTEEMLGVHRGGVWFLVVLRYSKSCLVSLESISETRSGMVWRGLGRRGVVSDAILRYIYFDYLNYLTFIFTFWSPLYERHAGVRGPSEYQKLWITLSPAALTLLSSCNLSLYRACFSGLSIEQGRAASQTNIQDCINTSVDRKD